MEHFSNLPGNPKVGFLRADVNHVENNKWPTPCIVENKNCFLSIVNLLDKPIKVK